MKIRMKGNSIRLRLMQKEVSQFLSEGAIQESILFGPNQKLIYQLRLSKSNQELSVSFLNQQITTFVPEKMGQEWASSDQVSMAFTSNDNGNELHILIEKDFKCLTDRPHEDESDAFPNPHTSC